MTVVTVPQLLLPVAEAVRPGSRVVVQFRRNERRMQGTSERKLASAFNRLGVHLAATAEKLGGMVVEEPTEEARRLRDNPYLSDELRETAEERAASERERWFINLLLGEAALNRWRQDELVPIFEEIWFRTGHITTLTLRRSGVQVTQRDRIQQALLRSGGKRAGLVDLHHDTKVALFRALDRARADGAGPRQIGRMIRSEVPAGRFRFAGSGYRATMIARTEILHSQRIGSLESYKKSNVVKEVMAYDGTEHDECAERNGQIFSFADADAETASTHPNCVLAWGPVLY